MNQDSRLPTLDGLIKLLHRWRGSPAYLVEYVRPHETPLGNNGDELLGRVFHRVLRDLAIQPVPTPAAAKLLLVRPGGALLDRYQAPRLLTDRLRELPDLPLIIFPHSSWFETKDPARMFAGRGAPTLWISREPRSHQHLLDVWEQSLALANVSLALDHDVVASGHAHAIPALELVEPASGDAGVLVVARLGVERGAMEAPIAGGSWYRRAAVRAFKRLPRREQILVRRRVTHKAQLSANAQLLARAAGVLPFDVDAASRSSWSFDVSDPTLATFAEYARAVSTASVVITDRLHVAMPAAILNKPTYLIESGYHKLAGVFEHSLTKMDNITFVPRV